MKNSKYWLDILCRQLISRHDDKEEIIIASGVTPSGPYHVGHAREILTAEAIRLALSFQKIKSRHLHFVDSFDALRKSYPFLPETYLSQVGKPLYLIPASDDKNKTYSQRYFDEFYSSLAKIGVEDVKIIWMHEYYQSGKMAEAIDKALTSRDKIAGILNRVSARKLDKDWQPIQILDDKTKSLKTAKFLAYNKQAGFVEYESEDGSNQQASIKKGEVKLDWRVDWPARWAIFGVDIEPFGREHASKGGSFDTGRAIAREVFGCDIPVPVPYESIHLKGQTKKMSSSVGNLVTVDQALRIIPPEILRFFILKSRPQKQLNFDPGIGMYNLIDEFSKVATDFKNQTSSEFLESYKFSVLDKNHQTVSKVPFSHLVSSFQTAFEDESETFTVLERSGYSTEVINQKEVIKKQLNNVKYWLEHFAPDNVKFSLQKKLPQINLSQKQKSFCQMLAKLISTEKNLSAQGLHDAIYAYSEQLKIKPSEAFIAIYQLFLNQDSGPKAGFFLASIDKKFAISRLELKA